MRVLLAIDALDTLGGSERYAREIAPVLAARGHEVRYLVEREPRAHEGDNAQAHAQTPVHVAATPTAAAQVAVHVRPEVVYVLGAREPRRVRALASVAPVVRHVQDHVPFCPGLNKLVQPAAGATTPVSCTEPVGLACVRRVWLADGCACLSASEGLATVLHRIGATLRGLDTLRRVRGIVVASDWMRQQLLQADLPAERLHTIPYFTWAASRALAPAALPAELDAWLTAHSGRVVLAAARLVSPDKGIEYLLTALGKLRSDAVLCIAGDGPARAWLEEKARAEGLAARTRFVGALSTQHMEALYPRCELVVFPSVWDEPFGLVGIEAMAHARAVLAFQGGGVPQWLDHDSTGRMVPRADTNALARELDALMAQPQLRLRMGRAGAARVEQRFRAPAHVERLERVLAAS